MPDFQMFRDLTAPLLKAGYFGAAVYFGLQWKLYLDINEAIQREDEAEAEAEDKTEQP